MLIGVVYLGASRLSVKLTQFVDQASLRPPGPLARLVLSPLLYFVVLVGTIVVLAVPHHFVPCPHPSCGEIYESYVSARNLETLGWKWAGLQDEATSPQPGAHPFLYIHHGDIGIYMSYLLRITGVKSIDSQNALSIVPFIIGLLLGYHLFSLLLDDRRAGAMFLLLSGFDYLGTGIWALNMLRSWSYVCLFGGLWALLRMERTSSRPSVVHILYLIASFLSIYIDYIFSSFLMFASLFFRPVVMGKIKPLKSYLASVAPFAAAFVFRQMQVILGAGWRLWSTDFLYQFLNRTHMEKFYQGNWSVDTARFYEVNRILNPGLTPGASWGERSFSFAHTVGYFFNVSLLGGLVSFREGVVTVGIGLLFLLMCVSVAVWHICREGRVLCPNQPSQEGGTPFGARFLLLILLCCLLEYALFPRYFLQWFPGFNLASTCVVCWGTIVFYLALASRPLDNTWAPVLMGVVGLKAVVLAASLLVHPLPSTDYISTLARLKGRTVVSDWIPSFAASHTGQFSAALSNEAIQLLPQRRKLNRKDFFLFVERDDSNPRYYEPEFFLLCVPCGESIYERTSRQESKWRLARELIDKGLPMVDRGRSFVLFRLHNP